MLELFKIVGKFAVDGADKVKKDIGSVTSTAEKSESKLGKVAKGIGVGFLGAAGAIGTGAVGLISKVTSSYGELEQSIGGIETLFSESKLSYEQFMDYQTKELHKSEHDAELAWHEQRKAAVMLRNRADEAYKTAGMSANEYMQQVTSFSASLLQSVGGDTVKAAKTADMAIIDMSDNANKMGTSMESITNAYQGFAKQNYTMLDNLKLGKPRHCSV